jgi:ABC-type antimicrobial peptide transport system permease subunit
MIMSSPYEPVKQALYIVGNPSDHSIYNLRLNPEKGLSEALGNIQAVFNKITPDVPFSYEFIDEEYARKFQNEERVGKLSGVFTGFAIFISCLGLFGLASFVAEQRTKEIGIRKVLGATIKGLWQMLSKGFVVLVFIACLIASPLAYYFMDNWLENYEYRITITSWVFIISCSGALILTLCTVSYQAIKAAMMNPVKSLRSE